MKEKLMSFIGKANQVFFFLASVGIVLMLSYKLIDSWLIHPWTPPQVTVIESDSKQEQSQALVEYEKIHVRKIKDVHVFELRSSYIQAGLRHAIKPKAQGLMDSYEYKSPADQKSVVNVMFVNSQNIRTMLFEKDVMVINNHYANFDPQRYPSPMATFNIFSVVSNDTNKDGHLDRDDRQDLYVTQYDGQQRILVMEDISQYELIGNNLLLISQKEENEAKFYEYNLNNKTLRKINTDIEVKQ